MTSEKGGESTLIQFPETAQKEWDLVAEAAEVSEKLKRRIERDTLVEREVERLRIKHEASLSFQQELSAAATPSLEMMTLDSYQNNPNAAPPADTIDGVMKEKGLCLVVGPSESGKSTPALQGIHCALTGTEFLGQPVTKVNGGAGILSYDMDAGQMLDWMSGFPNLDASKVSVVNAYKAGNPLGVPEFRSKIVEAWKAMGVKIVVIDSFSASFFGHDQNDAAQTMAHYRDLKQFALTEVEADALIVIAHSTASSPTKVRGSTVHKDVADTMIVVEVDPKTDERKISIEKYRESRNHPKMTPRILTQTDPVTHLVGVNLGSMSLAGLPIPKNLAAAQAFAAVPQPNQTPVAGSDSDQEDDDL